MTSLETPLTITQVHMPGSPTRPSCQRVLNAVFDVETCAVNVTNQYSQTAQKMAINVKQ